jgi:hypothetical protein
MPGEDGREDALWRLFRPSEAPKMVEKGRARPPIFTHPHPIFTLDSGCFSRVFWALLPGVKMGEDKSEILLLRIFVATRNF